jgi:hypothetical protein
LLISYLSIMRALVNFASKMLMNNACAGTV